MADEDVLLAAGQAAAEADWAAGTSPFAYVLAQQPDAYRRGYHTRKSELREQAAGEQQVSVLNWHTLDSLEMADGRHYTYLIADAHHTVVLTRWAKDGTPGAWWVGAQAAANAIIMANPLPGTETEAVLRAHMRDAAQRYENGEDITGYEAWWQASRYHDQEDT